MGEFFYNFMHPLPNAVTTVIMGVVMLYWLFVFLFGFGLDDLDLGFDFDVDMDAPDPGINDLEVESGEATHENNPEKSEGLLIQFLKFINVGKVPFMLVFSTFKLFLWVGTLLTTHIINVSTWGLSSLFILLPVGLVGIFFTKYATNPMVKFFKEIGYNGEEEIDFMGRTGKMLADIRDNKVGIAEFTIHKDPFKLNVISIDGSELKYGDYVMIVDEADDKKIYYVEKEISIRNLTN